MSDAFGMDGLADKLAMLSEAFLARLPLRLLEMEQAIDLGLAAPGEAAAYERLHRLLHTLAGSAGTFGFGELGRRAQALETELASLLHDGIVDAGKLGALALEARQFVAWCEAAKGGWKAVAPPTLEAAPARPDNERPVLVVDDDPLLAQDIVLQLEHLGYRVRIVDQLAALSDAVRAHDPCALIIDMVFDENRLAGATELASIRQASDKPIPAIFISTSNQYDARLAAVRAGSDGYFPKPLDMAALGDRLDVLTARKEVLPYRVLIMDDDPIAAEYYATVLRSASMEVLPLSDSHRILDNLSDFQPDLVLMDMYMPECSGVELARLIRQDNKYLDLPIVFLSSETNYGKQINAIECGADDFLEKPIEAHHLVTAIASRADRHRALRGLITRDSLTLLLNHSAVKDQLGRELARTQRAGLPLTLAMIDIDHFKKVNDSYGHPVGDQVIRVLARLLQHRLRRGDVIGRYGGEEFVVVFPNTSAASATDALEKVRQSFAKIKHHGNGQDFVSSFSAGIASAAVGEDAEALLKQADAMLYQAKRDGRDRIVAWDPTPPKCEPG